MMFRNADSKGDSKQTTDEPAAPFNPALRTFPFLIQPPELDAKASREFVLAFFRWTRGITSKETPLKAYEKRQLKTSANTMEQFTDEASDNEIARLKENYNFASKAVLGRALWKPLGNFLAGILQASAHEAYVVIYSPLTNKILMRTDQPLAVTQRELLTTHPASHTVVAADNHSIFVYDMNEEKQTLTCRAKWPVILKDSQDQIQYIEICDDNIRLVGFVRFSDDTTQLFAMNLTSGHIKFYPIAERVLDIRPFETGTTTKLLTTGATCQVFDLIEDIDGHTVFSNPQELLPAVVNVRYAQGLVIDSKTFVVESFCHAPRKHRFELVNIGNDDKVKCVLMMEFNRSEPLFLNDCYFSTLRMHLNTDGSLILAADWDFSKKIFRYSFEPAPHTQFIGSTDTSFCPVNADQIFVLNSPLSTECLSQYSSFLGNVGKGIFSDTIAQSLERTLPSRVSRIIADYAHEPSAYSPGLFQSIPASAREKLRQEVGRFIEKMPKNNNEYPILKTLHDALEGSADKTVHQILAEASTGCETEIALLTRVIQATNVKETKEGAHASLKAFYAKEFPSIAYLIDSYADKKVSLTQLINACNPKDAPLIAEIAKCVTEEISEKTLAIRCKSKMRPYTNLLGALNQLREIFPAPADTFTPRACLQSISYV